MVEQPQTEKGLAQIDKALVAWQASGLKILRQYFLGLQLLAELYNWFTEDFKTADLKRVKALLTQLT